MSGLSFARQGTVLLALALVTACSSGDDDDDVSGTSLTIEEYCAAEAALEQEWCTYLDTCCSAEDKAAMMYLPSYCDDLEATTRCVQGLSERVSAGTVDWHGGRAQACLDAQAVLIVPPPATCVGLAMREVSEGRRDAPGGLQIEACREMLDGQLGAGTPCDVDAECAAGLSCQRSDSSYHCAPVSTELGSCSSANDCAGGLLCVAGMCRASLNDFGGACDTVGDCLPGLMCGSDDYCVQPIQAGGFCESSLDPCDYGTACDISISRCVSYGTAGATCTSDFSCLGRCDTAAGRCVDLCGGTWY